MTYIKPFNEIAKGDSAIAGGKGASLGEMTRAGIPVPPGYVVTANAFEHLLESFDMRAQIQGELDQVNVANTASVERASEHIRAIFETVEMPPDLQKEILESFRRLDAKFVAVRSSATAEDSSTASWAGELESYLYTAQATLWSNIMRCWSSLFTPRAIFYRFEKGLKDTHVAVAVVVQKMIASEVSGICFTVHPVTKDPNQLIIEAVWGLGEAIVGGMITPDSYIVDKRTFEITDTYISEQTHKIVPLSVGGTDTEVIHPSERGKQKFSNEHVLELAKLCRQIEEHYGSPQDIEWALSESKLWVLQSRPITTL